MKRKGRDKLPIETLWHLVKHLPEEEREAAANEISSYLEIIMDIVDEQDRLTAKGDEHTLSSSV